MKATETLRALIMVCVGVICLNGYAVADQSAPAENDTECMAAVQETGVALSESAATQNGGIEKESVLAAIAAYVIAPWGAAATALTVFSCAGLIADAVLPEKNETPAIERMAVAELEIAASDKE